MSAGDAHFIPRRPEPEVMDRPDEVEAYVRADFAQVNEAFVDRLCGLTAGMAPGICADLGTGPADIPLRFSRRRPCWRILAVDASAVMLAFARRALAGMSDRLLVFPVVADARQLPLPAGGCDVVFSNSILHHLNDTAGLWREVRRVVRPGGLVFFRDLTRPPDEETARRIVEQYAGGESALLQEEYCRSLLAAYTPGEVRRQLAAARLEQLVVEQVTDRHLDIHGRV